MTAGAVSADENACASRAPGSKIAVVSPSSTATRPANAWFHAASCVCILLIARRKPVFNGTHALSLPGSRATSTWAPTAGSSSPHAVRQASRDLHGGNVPRRALESLDHAHGDDIERLLPVLLDFGHLAGEKGARPVIPALGLDVPGKQASLCPARRQLENCNHQQGAEGQFHSGVTYLKSNAHRQRQKRADARSLPIRRSASARRAPGVKRRREISIGSLSTARACAPPA